MDALVQCPGTLMSGPCDIQLIEPPVLDEIKAASNFFASSRFWIFEDFTRK